MTQEKVPATAEQGQAPAKNVEAAQAARSPEAQEVTAQAPKLAQGNHKEMPAAKTAPEAEAQAAAEAPAPAAEQFAYAAPMPQQAETAHAKYLDEKDEKDGKDDKRSDDASQDEAPVDLAMLSEIEFIDGGALPAQASENVEGLAFQDDASSDDGGNGAGIILPVLAVAAAGGGIAILAGSGNDPTDPPAPPPPPPPPANAAPVITSGDAAAIDENSPVDTVVYTATATDANNDTITYSLTGDDAAAFNIDAATGKVTFKESPDFETKESYAINVVANDGKGGTDTQAVTITINDLDDGAGTPVNLDEADLPANGGDGNPLTPRVLDAADGDFAYTDGDDVASTTTIQNFEEGDTIDFGGADVSFSTGADAKDLEMTVTVNGVVSTILLDDVLSGDFQLIETAEQAEAAVGFDFFVGDDAVDTAAVNDASFG